MKLKLAMYFAACTALLALPAAAGTITTTFTGINAFSGNMFDLTTAASGITLTSLGVNVGAGALTIDVYTKVGTYVGSETNPAAWTLDSKTAVTGLGQGKTTTVNINPFFLKAGTTYGVYITIDTNTNAAPYMYYTTGNNVYSNSDVSLSTGAALGGLFGSLALNANRTWDGTINYNLGNTAVPEPASFAYLLLGVPLILFRRR